MIVVGVDPGRSGGICVLGKGDIVAFQMPMMEDEEKLIDIQKVSSYVAMAGADVAVYIEKCHAMPHQGVTSMFSFGMGYGMLLGLFHYVVGALSVHQIPPQRWKTRLLRLGGDQKQKAIQYCERRWPQIDLKPGRKRTPHDGIADAVCIATYGAMKEGLIGD